jgi:hypothetical protein
MYEENAATCQGAVRVRLRAALRDHVQDWLGHANTQNTVIYTALSSRSREDKARKLFLTMPRY